MTAEQCVSAVTRVKELLFQNICTDCYIFLHCALMSNGFVNLYTFAFTLFYISKKD